MGLKWWLHLVAFLGNISSWSPLRMPLTSQTQCSHFFHSFSQSVNIPFSPLLSCLKLANWTHRIWFTILVLPAVPTTNQDFFQLRIIYSQVVVAYPFNPSSWEAEEGGSLSSQPAFFPECQIWQIHACIYWSGFLINFVSLFWNKVSYCISSWPRTHCVAQRDLNLWQSCSLSLPRASITGVSHHTQLLLITIKNQRHL